MQLIVYENLKRSPPEKAQNLESTFLSFANLKFNIKGD